MKDAEKQRMIQSYGERLKRFGRDPRTIGWPKRRHLLRYEILLSHWRLGGRSLLDFGCGFGDMYGFCRQAGYDAEYHGLDLNPELVAEGNRQYPEADLLVCDALVDGLPDHYDIIVSSGVHNVALEDNWGFVVATFDLFKRHARRGFALNFLTARVDYELNTHYHAEPTEILDLAYRYSRRVTLRNDYMPFEFTIFVDLDDAFDTRTTVFSDFISRVPHENGC